MKKLPFILFIVIAVSYVISSCSVNNEDTWTEYADWRNANNAWIEAKQAETTSTGELYYTKVVPSWNSQAYVLIHYFNDTTLTQNNLKPLYTSTCDLKYYGTMYEGTAFDSSYTSTSPADSIYRSYLPDEISGWAIALMNMHVGDSCEVIIPYDLAYGSYSSGSVYPYSHLKFGIKLVDIPGFVIKP